MEDRDRPGRPGGIPGYTPDCPARVHGSAVGTNVRMANMEGKGMDFPKDCLYSREHEWVRAEGKSVTMGITDYAQSALGDIVFVELPSIGQEMEPGEPFGSVEAVKAVSDLFSPVSGVVTAVNTTLEDDPTLVNHSPYDEGWMVKAKLRNESDLDGLLSPEEYEKLVAGLESGN